MTTHKLSKPWVELGMEFAKQVTWTNIEAIYVAVHCALTVLAYELED